MGIRHLNILIAVYEEKSMSKAAARLFMTQPAVSQAIKELEEEYGALLFERFSKCLYVTEAGEELYHYAAQIISLFEKSKGISKGDKIKEIIKIGANITVGTTMMQNYVMKYKEEHQNVIVQVNINNASKIKELLIKNELDFALLEEGKIDDYFNSEVFFEDRIVVIANMQNAVIKKEKIYLKDLVEEDFLLRERGAGVRDTFEMLVSLQGVSIQPTWESCSSKALINAVISGLGIAVLPYRLAKEYIDSGKVAELKIEDMNLNRKLLIVSHKNKKLQRAALEFIQIVKELKFE